MKKILLYGGAFDPIHNGHLQIANIVRQTLNANQIVWIIAKHPPLKEKPTSVHHRINMVKLAVKDDEINRIGLFETESLAALNYTIDTVNHYQSIYPNDKLIYLIGGDQVNNFHLWHQANKLANQIQIVAYGRPEYDDISLNLKRFNIQLIDGPLYDVNSTNIRLGRSLDVPIEVFNYIVEHELYFIKRLKTYFSLHRYNHSVSVSRLAGQIAKANNIDVGKTLLAAMFHDIGKNTDLKSSLQMTKDKYKEADDLSEATIHQFVGAEIARKDFNISDVEILDAIAYHATGKANMNPIGQILYSADKIEPNRGFDSSELINQCLNDYHRGFIEVLKANEQYHKDKNIHFKYSLTEQALNYYLGEDK
jgi:nicotinate-nucleotide adenylyltransferase